jgi:hypothetical protein
LRTVSNNVEWNFRADLGTIFNMKYELAQRKASTATSPMDAYIAR